MIKSIQTEKEQKLQDKKFNELWDIMMSTILSKIFGLSIKAKKDSEEKK